MRLCVVVLESAAEPVCAASPPFTGGVSSADVAEKPSSDFPSEPEQWFSLAESGLKAEDSTQPNVSVTGMSKDAWSRDSLVVHSFYFFVEPKFRGIYPKRPIPSLPQNSLATKPLVAEKTKKLLPTPVQQYSFSGDDEVICTLIGSLKFYLFIKL